MKTVKLKINGMSCNHCRMAVADVLEKIPEIKGLSVEIGLAEFTAPDEFELERVVEDIQELGYEVAGIESHSSES